MAGDLSIQESVEVASGSYRGSPQPILHEYGGLKISLGPARPGAPLVESTLDPNARMGLAAFKLRERVEFKEAKHARNQAPMNWGGEGRNGPLASPLSEPHSETAHEHGVDPSAAPLSAPSARLSGRIGVGIIIVSGPGALSISASEQTRIIAEIQNGLSYLAAASPARDVTFVHDINVVNVNAADNPNPQDWEAGERAWRDAALSELEHAPGSAGIRAFVSKVKSRTSAPYAYAAFFSKYTLFHFAYALPGSTPHLMMNYWNDGWGIDNIDAVFAHETCHIFGAPDEYSAASCNCGGRWGPYGVPNINCESCAPGGSVDCLMLKNTFTMCSATPYHVGYKGLPPYGSGSPTV